MPWVAVGDPAGAAMDVEANSAPAMRAAAAVILVFPISVIGFPL
jgi:hypothetical protein